MLARSQPVDSDDFGDDRQVSGGGCELFTDHYAARRRAQSTDVCCLGNSARRQFAVRGFLKLAVTKFLSCLVLKLGYIKKKIEDTYEKADLASRSPHRPASPQTYRLVLHLATLAAKKSQRSIVLQLYPVVLVLCTRPSKGAPVLCFQKYYY